MTTFPASLPVSALLPVGTFYDPKWLCIIEDLYDSRRMSDKKAEYLRPRSGDKTHPAYVQSRLASAQYLNHFAAKIQDVVAEILSTPPAIVVNPKALEVASMRDRAQYWLNLNTNCDGKGNDLRTVLNNAALELVKHGRGAFYAADNGIDSVEAQTLDDAECVNGIVQMVRTHTIGYERPAPYLPIDTELNFWTFYRPEGIYQYKARRSLVQARFDQWNPKTAVALLTEFPNPLPGKCSVFPTAMPKNYSLGHQLAAPALALWNRESAREYAIDMGALNQPVLKTDKTNVKEIFLSENQCISPGANGDFLWAAPPKQVFDALKESADDQRQLFDRTAAMPASHENQTQNARQSGKAKELDAAPKANLLSRYSEALRDGFERALKAKMTDPSDGSIEPRLVGLFSAAPDRGEVVADTQAFLELPGVPAVAKDIAVERAVMAFLPNLSQYEQRLVLQQLAAAKTQALPAPQPSASTGE